MPTKTRLMDIPKPQQVRLAFIEFRLLFLGSVNRPDLAKRFGVSESAASRDLALYRQLAPENILYNRSDAVYLPNESFIPLFEHSPEKSLIALSEGVGDDLIVMPDAWLPTELSTRLNLPSLSILVPVSRALYQGKTIKISYRSLSSGLSEKALIPLVLVDNGLRWHLRAYDLTRARFADFVLNRIETVVVSDAILEADVLRAKDLQWHKRITLELIPHPKLLHPESVAHEFAMSHGCLTVETKAALAGYLLRRWNVDCTVNHSLKGSEYLLWLRNSAEIIQLNETQAIDVSIAPGMNLQTSSALHGGSTC